MRSFCSATAVLAASITALVLSGCAGTGDISKRFSSASTSEQEQQAKKEAAMPHCAAPVGSVAIVAPEKNWWQAYQLQSPDALIKMFVAKSGCFTIVDRGRGFAVAERERALASGGNLQQGSNMGGGQIKAADYVITPDIVVNNNNAGGNAIGAILGSLIPIPGVAMIASQVSMTDKSAEVTLAVTDVRTSEQIILADGKAEKTDIGFGVGGGAFMGGGFGAAGVGSYANTALGQVVAMAYLDAYGKMVDRIRSIHPETDPKADATPAAPVVQPQLKPIAMAKAGHLFHGPSVGSGPIRELPSGSILYPTSKKSGSWWEVTDENGEKGWVSSRMLRLDNYAGK